MDLAPAVRWPGRRGYAGWRPLAGAGLDLDFTRNQTLVGSSRQSAASALTTSRASNGMAERLNGSWDSFGSNVARITDKGLLVEESRTNSVPNSAMQGVITGSPGTIPTGWSSSANGTDGLTRTVVGTGVEFGLDYVDIRWTGTATSTFLNVISFTTGEITASPGQTWTGSFFHRLVGGTDPGSALIYVLGEFTGAQGFLNATTGGLFPTSGLQRRIITRTLADPSAAMTRMYIQLNSVVSTFYDFTLRLYAPQVELGAFPTSPIRTTGAAATRAADVISSNNAAFLLSQFSIYAEIDIPQINSAIAWRVFEMSQGAIATNRIRCNGAGLWVAEQNSDGAVATSAIATGRSKIAGRFFANDLNVSVNGSIGLTDTTATALGAVTLFDFGNTQVASPRQMNGYLRRISLFIASKSDAQLQALTT